MELSNNKLSGPSYAVILLVVYFWFIIATPQVRFPIIGALQTEKWIIAIVVLLLVFSGRIKPKFQAVSYFYLILSCWMFVSYFQSPYQDFGQVIWWTENYWKLIVLYLILSVALVEQRDIRIFIVGVTICSVLYQVHSWYDFLRGGSYVYQQGLKRIVGVWSGGGIGSANAFGALALYTVPFCYYAFLTASKKTVKGVAGGALLICTASILFSGTRGALVALLVLLVYVFAKHWKMIIYFSIAAVLTVQFLPSSLQERYFSIITFTREDESSRLEAQENSGALIARESAQSRIEGLIDGFALGSMRPMVGFGPGASSIARLEKIKYMFQSEIEDQPLQLHNLYGQVVAELGYVGFSIFVLLVLFFWFQLYALRQAVSGSEAFIEADITRLTIMRFLVVLLVYGMVTHSLYDHFWIIAFAIQPAFINALKQSKLPDSVKEN